jgi:hypothetical protein
MIEAALRKTIEQFSDIVEFVEKLELNFIRNFLG